MVLPVTRQGVREVNCEQVLRTILREGPLARIDLAQYTGLTTAAISNITRELIESGLLCEAGTVRGGRVGANAILLDFPEDTLVIGVVHQGVTALRIALCNLRGKVLARHLVATPEHYTPTWAVTTIEQTLHVLLHSKGYTNESLVGIGMGLVGLIDATGGVVKRAPSIGWENVPFGEQLAGQLNRPVAIENNVRAMAFGEALLGKGTSWSDFCFVYVGTGIGSGLIIHGRPYRGAHGGAGEIGHITVDPAGVSCSCGHRGCLETIAAEPAIIRNARARGIVGTQTPSPAETLGQSALIENGKEPKEIVRAIAVLARMGNEAACEVVKDCAESLGIALANLVDIFNPSRIVLHGAIAGAGDVFYSSATHYLQQHAFTHDESVELVPATFGEDAGLVGAAAVALDAIVLPGGMRTTHKM